ncbi:hypothetical protein ATANTOWER_012198 [Ataeniobius toweri]|uniref:Uncharacterized protein n=1 Tax=Ataeniobius toweri TaxID=208326 RepID=A0ABU7B949_9TELE|nr:hypothetical protein [Ataeniobius toweri]
MRELGLSTRFTYSNLSDSRLDDTVRSIKSRIPHAGYRMVKGCLQADGHRVHWDRIKESMHRVDAPGVLEKMTQLGCIVRRTYCLQSLFLWSDYPLPFFIFYFQGTTSSYMVE